MIYHSWDSALDICALCGTSYHDVVWGNADFSCSAKTQPCCGNLGNDRWYPVDQKWKCSSCGKIKSDTFSNIPKDPQIGITDSPVTLGSKCTCGSAAVGSDKHSYYCDLYKK